MKVIILLAGKGTRFLPLTRTVPKPLIPVGGEAVLSHILATLHPLEIDELILVTGYLSEEIETFVRAHYGGPVQIVQQHALDGTGGAVNAARAHIDGPVLIIFGDTLFDADLRFLNTGGSRNLIWTRSVDDPERFGIVQKNEAGTMERIIEKPRHDVGRQANIGLYYISDHSALLAGLDHVMGGNAIGGEYFFTYALNHMVENGHPIDVLDVDGWHDCGTLDALLATNAYLLEQDRRAEEQTPGVEIIDPVRIHDSAVLEDCRIGPNVTIGAGSRITGSQIANSIVAADCDLASVTLDGSLVGPGETIKGKNLQGCIAANGETSTT